MNLKGRNSALPTAVGLACCPARDRLPRLFVSQGQTGFVAAEMGKGGPLSLTQGSSKHPDVGAWPEGTALKARIVEMVGTSFLTGKVMSLPPKGPPLTEQYREINKPLPLPWGCVM